MAHIQEHLIRANQQAINEFFAALDRRLGRYITQIIIIPLYGRINEFIAIQDAISFLDQHRIYEGSGEFRKYEVQVEFSNGDRVQASFDSKGRVREFLNFVSAQ